MFCLRGPFKHSFSQPALVTTVVAYLSHKFSASSVKKHKPKHQKAFSAHTRTLLLAKLSDMWEGGCWYGTKLHPGIIIRTVSESAHQISAIWTLWNRCHMFVCSPSLAHSRAPPTQHMAIGASGASRFQVLDLCGKGCLWWGCLKFAQVDLKCMVVFLLCLSFSSPYKRLCDGIS